MALVLGECVDGTSRCSRIRQGWQGFVQRDLMHIQTQQGVSTCVTVAVRTQGRRRARTVMLKEEAAFGL